MTIDLRKEALADEVVRDYLTLSSGRFTWESQWEEVANLVWPDYRSTIRSNAVWTPGIKKTELQFDVTAARALSKFGAILDSLLTPKNSIWHSLVPQDESLKKNRDLMLWLEQVNKTIFKYRYAPRANFAGQNVLTYMGLGAFGTGTLFIDPLDHPRERGLRYKHVPIGEVYYAENHQGQVDKVVRAYWLTGRQAMQKFKPDASLPQDFIDRISASNAAMEANYKFLHCVRPNADRNPKLLGPGSMMYQSIHVLYQPTARTVLREGGFDTFPFIVSRYLQAPGEVYGRGPAMEVLAAIKTLNQEKKTLLEQGHRAVAPALLTTDDGILDDISLKPGAVNRGGMSAEGRALVGTVPVGNVQVGKELMDDERDAINDAFLVSLFQILTETPEMTATEVIERTREKGILLAPTVGRQENEKLGPQIEREIEVLSRQGLLPPPPGGVNIKAMGGLEYEIQYDSPLSRAMRAEEVAGVMRSIESTLTIVNATQDPEPLDNFNFDVIVPEVSQIQGVPLRWMNGPDIIAQKRQARAQQAARQQQAAEAPGQAALMKASSVAQESAIRTGQMTPAQMKALGAQQGGGQQQ
ncbi:MAG TPA: portal protein [bacterium]|nr:portal protein [bacterium]